MIAVALITLSLLVLSVSATPVESAGVQVGCPPDFSAFVKAHAIEIDGQYYLTHKFNEKTLHAYIGCETLRLVSAKENMWVILNLAGHGWLFNDEVVAGSHNGRCFINFDVIKRLRPEIKERELKWIGIQTATNGVWVDVVWGSDYKPS